MSRDGIFIYIDKRYIIKKVLKDLKKEILFIESEDIVWIFLCVYSFLLLVDFLVGMWRKILMVGKVLWYNQFGILVKIIQYDSKGLQLYRVFIYIVENNNRDIVVFDYDLFIFMFGVLVVIDLNGFYCF